MSLFKLFKYYPAVKVLLEGIAKAKEDGEITLEEVVHIMLDAFMAVGVSSKVIYNINEELEEKKKA
jgi:hypothetical protein